MERLSFLFNIFFLFKMWFIGLDLFLRKKVLPSSIDRISGETTQTSEAEDYSSDEHRDFGRHAGFL